MDIFPIGTAAADTSKGTLDSISYSMFEPNYSCKSTIVTNILVEKFEQQTLHTRKKSEAYLTISYEYNNIFEREYRQIEHFIYSKDGELTSFYIVDFSKGITPSSVTESSGDWVVAIDNTFLYSAVVNKKAYYAFIWDGVNWKIGSIASLSTNTSITVDVDTDSYGGLTLANASAKGIVYPVYQGYAGSGTLGTFKPTVFIDENINTSNDGGWMRSGNISFTSKYKV